MNKDCYNCKYYDMSQWSIPCDDCEDNDGYPSNWKPEEIGKLELEKDSDWGEAKVVDELLAYLGTFKPDVNQPAHYTEYPKEVVDIIKFTLTEEQFKGWCIGNELKYRLRAGLKDLDKLYEDLDKAMKIREWRK